MRTVAQLIEARRVEKDRKAQARLLRKVDALEKLLDQMPPQYAILKWHRLTREAIASIRASEASDNCEVPK